MWPWSEPTLLREQLAKAEQRALDAEAALTAEREARMRDVRHVLGMWLRHERSVPLPPTSEEKAELQAERENRKPQLSADQLARRDAVRQWAKVNGFSQDEADEKFAETMTQMMDDE
jgi:hypothetical protein